MVCVTEFICFGLFNVTRRICGVGKDIATPSTCGGFGSDGVMTVAYVDVDGDVDVDVDGDVDEMSIVIVMRCRCEVQSYPSVHLGSLIPRSK